MNSIPKKINKFKLNKETVLYIEKYFQEYRYSKMIPLQLLFDLLNNSLSNNQIDIYKKKY